MTSLSERGQDALDQLCLATGADGTTTTDVLLQVAAEAAEAGEWRQPWPEVASRIRSECVARRRRAQVRRRQTLAESRTK